MNTNATIFLNHFSNVFNLLNKLPTSEKVNAIRYAKTITGSPVAIAKTKGRKSPDVLEIVMGISMPKYKTPLYGQNASAKSIPIKSELSRFVFI